jgi:hypothetical protein
LKSVVVVESTREVGGKIDREMRLYITKRSSQARCRATPAFQARAIQLGFCDLVRRGQPGG